MMRARNRHSASNYLFAALLELVIMGLFVVIAQPQLREALFEMLEPPARTIAAPKATATDSAARNLQPPSDASLSLPGLDVGWSMAAIGSAPLDQFEAFTVSTGGGAVAATPVSIAAEDGLIKTRVAGYAPAVGATQLGAIDWNIASAAQSPRPLTGSSLSGWTAPSRPAETDYRNTYPPPYGTQSQWK